MVGMVKAIKHLLNMVNKKYGIYQAHIVHISI